MIDLETEICVCNSLTIKDIGRCIIKNNFTTLDELLENDICPMGDKCEACIDEGFHNDGHNLPMVLAMLKSKKFNFDGDN